MDVANELLDAIEIIVDKKIRENTAQIYLGVCKSINGNTCVMSINGKNNTVQFYGSTPIIGMTYRVFVPCGNMSMAFVITGNDDRKGVYYSNPNLLDNWYFTNSVNQRGNTIYTGTGYTIDRWKSGSSSLKAEVTSKGLVLSGTTTSAVYLSQYLDGGVFIDDSYTISALVEAITGTAYFQAIYSDGTYGNATKLAVGLNALTIKTAKTISRVLFQVNSGASVTLKAAKLELGSQQTLAHQDADGNWVLNEIPDYGEQLRRCQYYSRFFGETIEIPCSNNGAGSYIEGTLPLTMRSGSGAISYGNSNLFLGNGTYYPVTNASVTSNGGRVKIGVNVNGQMNSNQQATLHLTNCSIVFDL